MTVRFGHYRLAFYISVFLLSGTILGLSANLASLFLPKFHKNFTIFSLIIPSLTIFVFLLMLQWSTPQIEAPSLFFLWALWLAMGAWSTDIVGFMQCDTLTGQRAPTKSGDMSAQSYCYQVKVIQAFSWMNFVLFAVAFVILMSLVNQAERLGRRHIWEEPIRELGWFGEWPGYYNTLGHVGQVAYSGYPMTQYQPGVGGYQQAGYNGYPAGQQGQSIIIQSGVNGQQPTVTTVPYQPSA